MRAPTNLRFAIDVLVAVLCVPVALVLLPFAWFRRHEEADCECARCALLPTMYERSFHTRAWDTPLRLVSSRRTAIPEKKELPPR